MIETFGKHVKNVKYVLYCETKRDISCELKREI